MTPAERDLLTRTVLGEAGGEPDDGKAAVAAVAINRLLSGKFGKSMADVVLQPNAFEAWSHPHKLMAYAPNDPAYSDAANAVAMAEAGYDPTGGATMFLNPELQTQMGRKQPKWAAGEGQRIGRHVFYGKTTKVADNSDDPFAAAFQGSTTAPSPQEAGQPAPATDDPFSAAFGGTPKGSPTRSDASPATSIAASASPPASGVLGGLERLGEGALRGVMDVGDTVTEGAVNAASGLTGLAAQAGLVSPDTEDMMSKFADDYALGKDNLRKKYDEAYPPSPPLLGFIPTDLASAGRVGGQIAATAPVLGPLGKGLMSGAAHLLENPLARAAAVGAGLGAGSAALTSKSNDAPVRQQIAMGGLLGAGVGAAAPVVVAAGRGAFNKLAGAASKLSSSALDSITNILKEIGLTPQAARNQLAKLGPDATLADLDPALRTEAATLAGRGGKVTSSMKGTFEERVKAGANRTADAVDNILGPKPDLTKELDDVVRSAQDAAGPDYDKAKASGQALDPQPVIDQIDKMLSTAVGSRAKALNEFRGYLHDPAGEPKLDIQALHDARQEMDDQIEKAANRANASDTSAGRNAVRQLRKIRGSLDQLLKTNPDMAAGDAKFATGMRIKDAVQTGTDIFKNGTRLEDIERMVKGAPPEIVRALQLGARVAIGDALDNSARGELTAAQMMFAKKSANREKLKRLFPGQADEVLDMVQADAAKRATENAVTRASATAELTAGHKRYQVQPRKDSFASDMAYGAAGFMAGDPSAGIGTALLHRYGLRAADAWAGRQVNKLATESARALSASGNELDIVLDQLTRHASRAKSTGRRVGNSLVNAGSKALPLAVTQGKREPLRLTIYGNDRGRDEPK